MPMSGLMAQAMRDEVTRLGVTELRTPADVDAFLSDHTGSALVFVNSVCGCAAGNARPALSLVVAETACPPRRATVFAGQDPEATGRLREHYPDLVPSSPCFLVLRDGAVARYVPRQQIEGHTAEAVAAQLREAFAQLADAPGA